MTAQSRVPAQKEGVALHTQPRLPGWLQCNLGLIGLAVIFLAFFFRTIFQAKPIAKLGVLQNVDALVNPEIKQSIVALGGDPSGFLIFFPNGHFAESLWSKLTVPLWNPYVGCGYPLFADPQSFIFSPVHLLGLFATPQAYNAGLLLEVALGAAGVFALSRRLGLSQWGALLAASAFGFCPKNLFDVDLGGSDCFFPWVMLSFVWLSEKPGLLRCLFVGLLCGLLPCSAHPETSLFAVFYSALLFLFLCVLRKNGSALRAAGKSVLDLSVTALTAIVVSAPLVVPFLEFFRTASFYKDAAASGSFLTSEGFVLSALAAQGEGSFFIGTAAVCLTALGASVRSSAARSVSCTFLICLLLSVPPAFLASLLSQKPFSYIATLYGLAELLILASVLAGIGLDAIIAGRMHRLRWFILALTCLTVAAVFPSIIVLKAAHYPDPSLIGRVGGASGTMMWILAGGSIGTLLAAVVAGTRRLPSVVCAIILLSINFATEATVARTALPIRPTYRMQLPPELEVLRSSQERFVATGSNFFLPNTSSNFGVVDFRSFSPLLPKSYADFVQAAGGVSHNLYFQDMPDTCSPLLDVAGVKYIVTRMAIAEKDFDQNEHRVPLPPVQPAKLADGVRLLGGRFFQDFANCQLDGRIDLRVHQSADKRLAIEWMILREDGASIWSSPQKLLNAPRNHQVTLDVHIPVPLKSEEGKKILLGVKLLDTWTGQYLEPAGLRSPQTGDATIVCAFEKRWSSDAGKPHFQLVLESQGKFRIYENTRAVPQAYFVKNLKPGESDEDLLSQLGSVRFPLRETAMIGRNVFVPQAKPSKEIENPLIELERPDCNNVLIKINSRQDGYLVLTDLYYPGWECLLDGKPSDFYRANYMFRAVYVPQGAHEVRFRFAPKSLQTAFWIAVICLTSLWLVALWGRTRRHNVSRA